MSQKQNPEELALIAKARLVEILTNLPDLNFIEFVDLKLRHILGDSKIFNLAENPTWDEDEIVTWITTILQSENIQGDYLLMFEYSMAGIEFPPRLSPWAKVKFTSDYGWIRPLWNLAQSIYIMSVDEHYFLEFMREEYIITVDKWVRNS